MKPTAATPAVLKINSWAGIDTIRVVMLAASKTRAKVRLGKDCLLPGKRQCRAGDDVIVPLSALRFEQ